MATNFDEEQKRTEEMHKCRVGISSNAAGYSKKLEWVQNLEVGARWS